MISQLEKGEEPWLIEREVSGGPSAGKSKADGAFVMFARKLHLKPSPDCGEGRAIWMGPDPKPDYHLGTPFLHLPLLISCSGVRGKEVPLLGLVSLTNSPDPSHMVFLLPPAFQTLPYDSFFLLSIQAFVALPSLSITLFTRFPCNFIMDFILS